MLNLEPYLAEIALICQANDVKKLELFGSYAREDYNAESDMDFIVEFNDILKPGLFDRYLSLQQSLEKIFSKKVDLIEVSSLRNPILKKYINLDRFNIYEA